MWGHLDMLLFIDTGEDAVIWRHSKTHTRAPAIRIRTRFRIRIDWIDPGYVHTGGEVVAVNDCIPEGIYNKQ